jgi:hypothetical protein
MKSLPEQTLGVFQQNSRNDHNQVCVVANFLFLCFGSEGNELGSGMHDLRMETKHSLSKTFAVPELSRHSFWKMCFLVDRSQKAIQACAPPSP